MTQGNVRQGEAGASDDGCAPLPAMPGLALDLTPDAVRLLRREGPPGPDAPWAEVARAAIDREGNVRGISRLRSAAGGRRPRVVTVTSVARFTGGPIDPANPHLAGRYDPWLRSLRF